MRQAQHVTIMAVLAFLFLFLTVPYTNANVECRDPGCLSEPISWDFQTYWEGIAFSSNYPPSSLLNATTPDYRSYEIGGSSVYPVADYFTADVGLDVLTVLGDTVTLQSMDGEVIDTIVMGEDVLAHTVHITDIDQDDNKELILHSDNYVYVVELNRTDNALHLIHTVDKTAEGIVATGTASWDVVCLDVYSTYFGHPWARCAFINEGVAYKRGVHTLDFYRLGDNLITTLDLYTTNVYPSDPSQFIGVDADIAPLGISTTKGNMLSYMVRAMSFGSEGLRITSVIVSDTGAILYAAMSENSREIGKLSFRSDCLQQQQKAFIANLGGVTRMFWSGCGVGIRSGQCGAMISGFNWNASIKGWAEANDDADGGDGLPTMSNFAVGDVDNDGYNEACLLYKRNYTVQNGTPWLTCWKDSTVDRWLDLNMSDIMSDLEMSAFLGIINVNNSNESDRNAFVTHQRIFTIHADNSTTTHLNTGFSDTPATSGKGAVIIHNGIVPAVVYAQPSGGFIVSSPASSLELLCGNGLCEPEFGETPVTCEEDCAEEPPFEPNELGEPCETDDDCLYGYCVSGTCQQGTGGEECNTDEDCLSGSCVDGECKNAGLIESLLQLVESGSGGSSLTLNAIAILIIVIIAAGLIAKFGMAGVIASVPWFALAGGFFVLIGWLYAWIFVIPLVLLVGGVGLFVFMNWGQG